MEDVEGMKFNWRVIEPCSCGDPNCGPPNISDIPITCNCGWSGAADDMEPNIDGNGNHGCPMCSHIVEIMVKEGVVSCKTGDLV